MYLVPWNCYLARAFLFRGQLWNLYGLLVIKSEGKTGCIGKNNFISNCRSFGFFRTSGNTVSLEVNSFMNFMLKPFSAGTGIYPMQTLWSMEHSLWRPRSFPWKVVKFPRVLVNFNHHTQSVLSLKMEENSILHLDIGCYLQWVVLYLSA